MEAIGGGIAGGISLVLIALAVLVVILWIFLPFAVFGLKPLLKELSAAAARRDAALLEEMRKMSSVLESAAATVKDETK